MTEAQQDRMYMKINVVSQYGEPTPGSRRHRQPISVELSQGLNTVGALDGFSYGYSGVNTHYTADGSFAVKVGPNFSNYIRRCPHLRADRQLRRSPDVKSVTSDISIWFPIDRITMQVNEAEAVNDKEREAVYELLEGESKPRHVGTIARNKACCSFLLNDEAAYWTSRWTGAPYQSISG